VPALAFPYLALLPHLRVLECKLRMMVLTALGLLPQLEELRLWPVRKGDGVEAWVDGSLHMLGGLPLPQLHTLRLRNSAERESRCSVKKDGISGGDPDFPCQLPSNRVCRVLREYVSSLRMSVCCLMLSSV